MLSLKDLLKTPETKRFRYGADPINGFQLIPEDDAVATPVFELEVEYKNERQRKEILGGAISRKAVKKGGLKALAVSEEVGMQRLCRHCLKGWRMTVRGVYMLEAPVDLGTVDGDQEVEFTPDNVELMATHSLLASVVWGILTEHSNWFDAPEGVETEDDDDVDDENADRTADNLGNSGSGSGGSTDG